MNYEQEKRCTFPSADPSIIDGSDMIDFDGRYLPYTPPVKGEERVGVSYDRHRW